MPENESVPLRQALLARLRFERSLGIECIHPVALKAAPVVTAPPSSSVKPPAPPVESRKNANGPTASLVKNIPSAVPGPDNKAERWRFLEARALACKACALAVGRTTVVFGTGNRDAQLVFVGEGPGFDEDQQGIPFVGR